MPNVTLDDLRWMKTALSLAGRGLGNVAPNPSVACLIVKENRLVSRGWTQPSGRPHAEAVALALAGEKAHGATAYVTLEPCAHVGKTAPCAKALVEAGVIKVVIAAPDSDPRVDGKGASYLKEAGVQVVYCPDPTPALQLNKGFFLKVEAERPLVALKIASTLDGKIATRDGESKWITGPRARTYGHMLRAKFDAILIGCKTVLADDPDLTCRIEGLEHRSPIRIVLDTHLTIPLRSKLVASAHVTPLWVFYQANSPLQEKVRALEKSGVKLFGVTDTTAMADILKRLAFEGITRLLVEGGGQVHASFLRADCVDILYHMIAGKCIGADGISAIGGLSLAHLADAPHLKLMQNRQLGDDLLATYVKAE